MERGFIKSVTYPPMRSRAGEKVIYASVSVRCHWPNRRRRKAPRTVEEKDAEVLGLACDTALTALPADEREAIEQEARAGWPEFMLERLDDPTSIAAKEHQRVVREIVNRDHQKRCRSVSGTHRPKNMTSGATMPIL